MLYANDNTTGQGIDGIGDLAAGLKFAILMDAQTGSCLTGGMTVGVPTGRDAVVQTRTVATVQSATATMADGTIDPGGHQSQPSSATTTTKVNPTILQPYLAGVLAFDRFYVQEYIGVVIPTDDRLATFINNDLSVGYQVYRGQGGLLSPSRPRSTSSSSP